MDDNDFYVVSAWILMLALATAALSHTVRQKIARLEADVEFLKDHTVARETEARP